MARLLPIPEPWRTQGDYRDDQRRSRLLYRVAMASVVVAALTGVATAVSAYAALQAAPNPVKVECVVAPTPTR